MKNPETIENLLAEEVILRLSEKHGKIRADRRKAICEAVEETLKRYLPQIRAGKTYREIIMEGFC